MANGVWRVLLALVLATTASACSSDDNCTNDEKSTCGDEDADAAVGGGDYAGGGGGGGGNNVGKDKVPFEAGEAVEADPMTWKYVSVPGTKCRDGKETGFGININPDSDKLIIYMEGGGACFNNLTCIANPKSWGESNLGTPGGVLSRDEGSPFADWNLVYMPYCTGDVFSGTAGEGHNGEPQQGYTNVGLYLERIVPTFPDVKMVILSGSSAGGFGASWNGLRTQDAFGEIPVHVLDDSGPPFSEMVLSSCMQQRLGALWGWSKSVHPACKDCDVESGNVVVPLVNLALDRADGQRFGVTSYNEDGVIKTFLGYGLNDCAMFDPAFLGPSFPSGEYPKGLAEIRERTKDYPDFAMFEVVGGGHTFLGSDLSVETSGVTMRDWIVAFRDGTADFVNVTP